LDGTFDDGHAPNLKCAPRLSEKLFVQCASADSAGILMW
jgi:hypothetical protein